jgi:hypothetical protein
MTAVEALKSVQFVVNTEGRPTAALLSIEAWEALINLLEDVVDMRSARQALSELQAAGGRPRQAGWLAWDEIEAEWDDEAPAV